MTAWIHETLESVVEARTLLLEDEDSLAADTVLAELEDRLTRLSAARELEEANGA